MQGFIELAVILSLATAVSFLLQRAKLPLILGYILTGMLAGPLVLGWIHDPATVEIFSKLGITALLFIVGLNLTPSAVKDVGRVAVAVGLGQIFVTTLVGFGLVFLLGFRGTDAVFLAVALTFSSTIIALKSLQDRRDLGKLYARIAVGVLLVQDLVATGILVALSSTAGGASALALGWAVIKLFALGAGLWFVAAFVLPRLTPAFAASQEFLLLFSVAWGMGIAALFQLSGFSLEIGALAAGVALATSPYHLEISAKMKLLRDFFLVLFFVLLGSQLAFGNAGDLWLPVIVLSAYVLIGNPLIVSVIMGAMGYRRKTGFYTGLTMAQVSEFSLVFLLLGRSLGYVDTRVVTLVTLVALVTFTASSLMLAGADDLFKWLKKPLGLLERKETLGERRALKQPEAILFGAHRLGYDFLPLLAKLEKPYLIVDFNPTIVRDLQNRGLPVLYGDASENELLDEFDLKKASLLVSTIPDLETNLFLVSKLRKRNKEAVFLSTAQSAEEAMVLYEAGADYVILPHYLGGNYAALLLEKYGLDSERFGQEREKHLKHLQNRLASV
ncbi:MAG TPA: cation:proton antiporter family protein [Verrucomicrobiae bacterium]|nr:cation:proton antiporter family protein [Verrucomicrobiae bacterium]